MPLYPFFLLGAMFLGIIVVPPLVAAYLDYRRESSRQDRKPTERASRSDEPRRSDENDG